MKRVMDPTIIMQSIWILVEQFKKHPDWVGQFLAKTKFLSFLITNVKHYDISALIAVLKILRLTLDNWENQRPYAYSNGLLQTISHTLHDLTCHGQAYVQNEAKNMLELVLKLHSKNSSTSTFSVLTNKPNTTLLPYNGY